MRKSTHCGSVFGPWDQNHRIHVWYRFTYIWLMFMVNVGSYTIHGPYGKISLRKLLQAITPLEKNYLEAEVPSLASSFSKGKKWQKTNLDQNFVTLGSGSSKRNFFILRNKDFLNPKGPTLEKHPRRRWPAGFWKLDLSKESSKAQLKIYHKTFKMVWKNPRRSNKMIS